MSRFKLNVQMEFENLTCERSDDWWGGSEPYLWIVFFTIDGTTVRVLPTTRLTGTGMIASSNGSHGNLGVPEMNTGDVAPVPGTIGLFKTTLVPIPVDPPLSGTVPDASGVVGAAVILWVGVRQSWLHAAGRIGAVAGYFLFKTLDPPKICCTWILSYT
jgi:hypothetical protein